MKLSLKKQKEYIQSLIDIFKEQGYSVIKGKGSFKQGSCLVMQNKKIVINGFLPPDMQIKFLVETAENQNILKNIPEEIQKFAKKVG